MLDKAICSCSQNIMCKPIRYSNEVYSDNAGFTEEIMLKQIIARYFAQRESCIIVKAGESESERVRENNLK